MPQKRKAARVSSPKSVVVAVQAIEKCIHVIRGQKVIMDRDIATLYRVPTRVLKQAMKRNADRFPEDFAYPLSKSETESLISQNVISTRRSVSRTVPTVFTEQGVAMLSSVLKSSRAAQVNVSIMRAFVRMRAVLAGQEELLKKLDELEKKYQTHDSDIKVIFDALKILIQPPPPRRIGFVGQIPPAVQRPAIFRAIKKA
jgi:hypothetical protein